MATDPTEPHPLEPTIPAPDPIPPPPPPYAPLDPYHAGIPQLPPAATSSLPDTFFGGEEEEKTREKGKDAYC